MLIAFTRARGQKTKEPGIMELVGPLLNSNLSEKTRIPWTGFDVLLFFILWLVAQHALMHYVVSSQEQPQAVAEKNEHKHPIHQLLEQEKNTPAVLFIAFLTVVIAAPLIEELLFRLFLQGWLEAKLAQRQIPYANVIAIVAVSYFFAIIHGGPRNPLDTQTLLLQYTAVSMTSLLIFALGICYLMRIRGMSVVHCFIGPESFFRPRFLRNAGYCVLALTLILGLSGILNGIVPDTNTDPIPIFFLSLVLGMIYSRTRNLSYCILLHACLNLTSLAFVLLSVWI